MRSFTLVGDLSNGDGAPEQGKVFVTPSKVLRGVDDTAGIVVAPLKASVDQGEFEIKLPAAEAYEPEFYLTMEVRLNSGYHRILHFNPFSEGELVDYRDLVPIEKPLDPPSEVEYAGLVLGALYEALQAQRASEAAAEDAEDEADRAYTAKEGADSAASSAATSAELAAAGVTTAAASVAIAQAAAELARVYRDQAGKISLGDVEEALLNAFQNKANAIGSGLTGVIEGEARQYINTEVPPRVQSELAKDSTPALAAAEAVEEALTQAGTFTGVRTRLGVGDDAEIGVAFEDENGFIAVWNATTKDGGPLPEAIEIIRQISESALAEAFFEEVAAIGYSFVLLDENDYIGLAIRDDGTIDADLSSELIASIVEAVAEALETGPAQEFIANPGGTAIRIAAATRCHAGDSLTASGRIRTRLDELLPGTPAGYSAAVGGEKSFGIAARLNAIPWLMRPVDSSGNPLTQWPASGSVDVKFTTSLPGSGNWPLLQGTGGGARGELAGVEWDFSIRQKDPAVALPSHGANDIYQLTRVTPGSAIPYKAPVPFIYNWGKARRNDILIAGIGQNGSGADLTALGGISDVEGTLIAARAMVQNLNNAKPRYLFWCQTGVTNTGWSPMEIAFAREFGRHFVNVRRFLIDEAFAYAGVEPDADNLADIAAGTVPRYFRTDSVHHTQEAQALIAEFAFLPRLKELEYIG